MQALIAVLCLSVLVVGLEARPAAAAPAQPAAGTAQGAPSTQPLSRPDLMSAAVTARAAGRRVEVLGADDAFSTTYANPDGTLSTESHAAPIRFKDSHGHWQPVDLTLQQNPDGSVSPKGHPLGLRLAGAGSARDADGSVDVATAGEGSGRQVALAWPGKLPQPMLHGSTATYADVAPGVDMVIEALRTGYEQKFVVKQRPAGVVSWQLPLHTKG